MGILLKSILTDIVDTISRENSSAKVKANDIIAFLTYRCTSKCKTCNIWRRNSSKENELNLSEWKHILYDLKTSGIKSFEIFGGDALLRKDIIFDIIQFCKQHNIKTFFPTNSILMDKKTAYQLVEAGLYTIYLSLDNVETKNDDIRGVNNSFYKVKEALETLLEAKEYYNTTTPYIIICTTISNLNYSDFYDIVMFLKKYPVNAIYPRIVTEFPLDAIENTEVMNTKPSPYFVTTEGKSHFLTSDELTKLKSAFKKLSNHNQIPYINFQGISDAPDSAFLRGSYGYRRCLVCSTVPVLTPQGDILPCPFFPDYKIGNILNNSLHELWGNKKHRTFIQSQRTHKIKLCNYCLMPSFYPTLFKKLKYYLIRLKEKN